jgi:hypothetical protein
MYAYFNLNISCLIRKTEQMLSRYLKLNDFKTKLFSFYLHSCEMLLLVWANSISKYQLFVPTTWLYFFFFFFLLS